MFFDAGRDSDQRRRTALTSSSSEAMGERLSTFDIDLMRAVPRFGTPGETSEVVVLAPPLAHARNRTIMRFMDGESPRCAANRCAERLGWHAHCDVCGLCPGIVPGDEPSGWWLVRTWRPPDEDRGPESTYWLCPGCLPDVRRIVERSAAIGEEALACLLQRGDDHAHCHGCGRCEGANRDAEALLPVGWWNLAVRLLGSHDETTTSRFRLCPSCTEWVWSVTNEELSADAIVRTGRGFHSIDEMATAFYDHIVASLADRDEETRLSRLLLRTPSTPDLLFKRGRIRLNRRDYRGAVADFTRAIRFAPEDALYYRERAVALHSGGRTAEALEDLAAALRLNDADGEAHAMCAQLLAPTDASAAARHRELALKADPEIPTRWFRQALILLEHRDRAGDEEAVGSIDRAIVNACWAVLSLDEKHARTHAVLAIADANLGRWDDAKPRAVFALVLAPEDELVQELARRVLGEG
jgi:tetratricopeptide (TPR) repeat protein